MSSVDRDQEVIGIRGDPIDAGEEVEDVDPVVGDVVEPLAKGGTGRRMTRKRG